jgi:hypothetical protein
MPLSTFDEYQTLTQTAPQYHWTKDINLTVSARIGSSWLSTPNAGATPTTAAALTAASTGALLVTPPFSTFTNSTYLVGAEFAIPTTQLSMAFVLCDRLSHQGGLSGTVTTAQTTNLPTAALTRYTTGAGVMIALEIYTIIGTTATTVTASYTNQAGTAGRTTKAVTFGGTANREVGRVFVLPLQDGDTGARSVESVTVLANTTSAGAFGVTLFKPLATFPNLSAINPSWDGVISGGDKLPRVQSNACLWLIGSGSVTGSLSYSGILTIGEVA